MKKRTLFTMGLAAVLFAGCSDEATIENGGNTDGNGKAYVALRIQLPTTSANAGLGRAANDEFDEGTADEYKVNTVDVYYLDNGTVVDSKSYTDIAWQIPSAGTSITSEAVLPVEKVAEGIDQVLVMLNKPAGLTITNNTTTKENLEEAMTGITAKTFTGDSNNNFFMANAALSDGTLYVDVTPAKTEAAAMADTRTIYVERAVGKVSFNPSSSTGWLNDNTNVFWTYTVQNADGDATSPNTYVGDKITLTKYALDVTNTTSFPLHNAPTAYKDTLGTAAPQSNNRFMGTANYTGNAYYANNHDDNKKAGRMYYAIDPNYGTYVEADFAKAVVADTATTFAKKMNAVDYCLENTFNVANQKQNQTTRTLIQAVYVPHAFSNFDGTANNSYATASYTNGGKNWYTIGNSNKPYNNETLLEMAKMMTGNDNLTLKATAFKAGEQAFVADMFENETTENITALTQKLGKVTCYVNGVCYYVARIKHFGDTYTPWGAETSAPAGYEDYTAGDFLTMSKNYLGRYGIVRNNWYQLQVNKVTSPGSPVIPETPDTPDDEQYYYLQTTVKILDWAVRKQGIDL